MTFAGQVRLAGSERRMPQVAVFCVCAGLVAFRALCISFAWSAPPVQVGCPSSPLVSFLCCACHFCLENSRNIRVCSFTTYDAFRTRSVRLDHSGLSTKPDAMSLDAWTLCGTGRVENVRTDPVAFRAFCVLFVYVWTGIVGARHVVLSGCCEVRTLRASLLVARMTCARAM